MAEILSSAFSGSFYPGNRDDLLFTVKKLLNRECSQYSSAIGAVIPHAGYIYSGRTAGLGFASAPDIVENVVVCAPSHRYPLKNATVFDVDGIETPLGICPVNRELTGALSEDLGCELFYEHSFEVMVPFIQVRWPEAEIVPLILGASPDCTGIAELIETVSPDSFFIGSSDLSHFHPLEDALELDERIITSFLSLDPAKFIRALEEGGEACGRYPILTLLHLASMKGAEKAVKLDHSTSADSGAGRDDVVGYFSGMVYR